MAIDRRTALAQISTIVTAAAFPGLAAAAESPQAEGPSPPARGQRLRRIATEEAFTIPEVAEATRDVVRRGGANLDLKLLTLIYGAGSAPPSVPSRSPGVPPAADRDALARTLLPRLLDLEAIQLAISCTTAPATWRHSQ